MDKNLIYQMVQEEVKNMISESKSKAPKIAQELEKLRKKFHPDMMRKESQAATEPAKEKRVQLSTVAEILDIPVSELMLYFLNEVKHTNQRHLVEYHGGLVYFYAE